MPGKTIYQHGVDVGCVSKAGVNIKGTATVGNGGGTVGATKFPHGVSVPFYSIGGTPVAPGTLVGATKFPHGVDAVPFTVAGSDL